MTHTLQLPKNLLMSSRRCPPWAPCLNSRRSQFPRPPCGAQNTAKHYISHAKACERGKEPFHREKRTCVCVCQFLFVLKLGSTPYISLHLHADYSGLLKFFFPSLPAPSPKHRSECSPHGVATERAWSPCATETFETGAGPTLGQDESWNE